MWNHMSYDTHTHTHTHILLQLEGKDLQQGMNKSNGTAPISHWHHCWCIEFMLIDSFMWKDTKSFVLFFSLHQQICAVKFLTVLYLNIYITFIIIKFLLFLQVFKQKNYSTSKKNKHFFRVCKWRKSQHSHIISVENNWTNLPFRCLVFIARICCFWIYFASISSNFSSYISRPDL